VRELNENTAHFMQNDQPPRGNWSTIFATAASNFFRILIPAPPTTVFSDAAKDKLLRVGIDEIEDQCAFTVSVHVGIGDRSAVPHAVTAVTVRPAAVIAVAPVSILLHRNFLMNKDLTNNIEIGLFPRSLQ
jgi:hypothetical protein